MTKVAKSRKAAGIARNGGRRAGARNPGGAGWRAKGFRAGVSGRYSESSDAWRAAPGKPPRQVPGLGGTLAESGKYITAHEYFLEGYNRGAEAREKRVKPNAYERGRKLNAGLPSRGGRGGRVVIPRAILQKYKYLFGGTISPAALKLIRKEYGKIKNPGAGAFERCVKEVAARGSAHSPRGVCAAAGRRKYGAAKFARMATAGRKRAHGNPSGSRYRAILTAKPGTFLRGGKRKVVSSWFETRQDAKDWVYAMQQPNLASSRVEAGRGRIDIGKGGGWVRPNKGRRSNPIGAAAERYELFHGREPGEIIEVTTKIHEHGVLSGIGKLVSLKIAAIDGTGEVTLSKFCGALLAQNEAGTQLFIEGGDQSVKLADFIGSRQAAHEMETLGPVLEVVYSTQKDHLRPEDGGKGEYRHIFGKGGTRLPLMVYDVTNRLLKFSGGGYDLPEVGIRG